MSRLLIKITATVVVARFEQTLEERTAGVMRLRWSNAGHPPPIVVERPDSADTEHSADILWSRPNVLLGLSPDLARDEQVMTLRHGATLLFYTDGLVERRGELIDDGIARLAAAFTALVAAGVGLEQLCDELLRRMLADRPVDDVALVAVRVQSTPDHLSPVDGL
jgi:serine phosphatase RsbU (regulator of sigma subunit)